MTNLIKDLFKILFESKLKYAFQDIWYRLFQPKVGTNFEVQNIITTAPEKVDWGLDKLGIPSAWTVSTGEGVKVCILDSGIDLNHPDLAGAVVASKDFTGSGTVQDFCGHGTHVAGIIAARKNGIGVIGVAPNCQLYIGKVLDSSGSGNFNWIVDGINWAIENRVHIISMSLGGGAPYEPMRWALNRATNDYGITVIAAAGNDGAVLKGKSFTTSWPANYDNVIAVGSINRNMQRSDFSSIGDEVDIMAPGEEIYSTYPPSRWALLSGTSMATPFVSGVAALIVAKHLKDPGETPIKNWMDLKQHLLYAATPVGNQQGKNQFDGWGIIDPSRELKED